jgi:hypothetical protein
MGHLAMGNEKTRSVYYHEQAKVKPLINNTRYERLSLGDVQTHDGILETMCTP